MRRTDRYGQICPWITVLATAIMLMGCYRGVKEDAAMPDRMADARERSTQRRADDVDRVFQRIEKISSIRVSGMQVRTESTEDGAALVLTSSEDVAQVHELAQAIIEVPEFCCEANLVTCCVDIRAVGIQDGVQMHFSSPDPERARQFVRDLAAGLLQR